MDQFPPLISTLTLFAELVVSAIIYLTLFVGYKRGKFLTIPAFGALIYETLFNITYMVSRSPDHVKSAVVTPLHLVILGAAHGILSLIMFACLIVFFILAWKNYNKGVNYFREHKTITYLFAVLWTFSILSGILFFLLIYVIY